MTRILNWLIAIALALVPAVASAHVGIGDTHGLVHGFSHPLSGLDQILVAMVAVGLFQPISAAGRCGWCRSPLCPSWRLQACSESRVWGCHTWEIGIGMSVVVLGLAIALQLNISTLAAMGLVGFFAIFHGHAHGAEMSENTSAFAYGVGFVCATALLHAVVIGLGLTIGYAEQTYGRRIVQVGGGAMAIAGVAVLVGIL